MKRIVPGTVVDGEERRQRKENMVKVGIIGLGFMGKMHAEVYKNLPAAKLVAVSDTVDEKAEEVAKNYDCEKCSPEELLEDREINVIDICLPTYLHKEYVVKAARRGKNILCEKPIAQTLEDADEMIKASKDAGVKFMVGHVIRFWKEYKMLREIFKKRQLGKMLSISCIRLNSTPMSTWNNWALNPELSGSAILDLHIHDTDYLLWLLGRPTSLFSRGVQTSTGWSHILTTYAFSEEIIAFAEGGWDMAPGFPFSMSFTAVFEKGAVTYNNNSPEPFVIYEEGKKPFYGDEEQEVKKKDKAGGNISDLGGYYTEIKYFIECICAGRSPEVITPEEARLSLEIVLAEKESLIANRIVNLQ